MKTKGVMVSLIILLASFSIVGAKKPNNAIATMPTSGITRQEEVQNRINEKKIEIENKREAIRKRIEVKKATQAAKLQDRQRERVRTYFGRLNTRFVVVIERLYQLINRIEARLAIYKSEFPEQDYDEIHSQLSLAKELLAQAEANITVATDKLDLVVDSGDPKDGFSVIKDEIAETKSILYSVHQLLVHVIGDIKGLRLGNTPTNTVE
jgi:hypothetical protein